MCLHFFLQSVFEAVSFAGADAGCDFSTERVPTRYCRHGTSLRLNWHRYERFGLQLPTCSDRLQDYMVFQIFPQNQTQLALLDLQIQALRKDKSHVNGIPGVVAPLRISEHNVRSLDNYFRQQESCPGCFSVVMEACPRADGGSTKQACS